ncbi:MAG: hypothetical protein M3133_06505 [Actinomycetota bacterium]|nr:hypothetical protein [Actinomycetota bacterium]
MEDQQLARVLAASRVGLGTLLLLAPSVVARAWVGEGAEEPSAKALARALGARDVALGLGALIALSHGESPRGWLEASALADAGDALATLVGWAHLPTLRRWLALGASVSAAYLGTRLARREAGAAP